MRSAANILFYLITISEVTAFASSCNIFLNDSINKNEFQNSKSIRHINSQKLDASSRKKWNDIWDTIPQDNYAQKITELEELNYDAYLKFQFDRIFYSYTLKLDPAKLKEWVLIDAYLRKLLLSQENLSLDLIIDINSSLTTNYSGSSRHGRLRALSFEDDFYRFAPNFHVYKPIDVKLGMQDLLRWYSYNRDILHPIELATIFYQRFITIHPFMDGNGRTGALLLSFILLTNNYPPPVFSDIRSAMMMRSLDFQKDVSVSDALSKITEGIILSTSYFR
jgi:hypothetical protein